MLKLANTFWRLLKVEQHVRQMAYLFSSLLHSVTTNNLFGIGINAGPPPPVSSHLPPTRKETVDYMEASYREGA